MRLTELNRPKPTTVAATLVLVAAAMLAGRGDAADPFAGTISLESGVAAPITDRALRAPELPAVSVGEAKVKHDKGTPELASSAYSELDIPDTALAAYQRAAVVMEQVDESCGLSWTLLAAIGRVESDHGRYAGSQLLTDGTSSPEIRGVPLDGRGPVAKIRDTDGGRLDRDTLWDRAVGPMQFLPSTWSVVGVDADSDGVRSPHDIDDAALATGVFLCSAAWTRAPDSGPPSSGTTPRARTSRASSRSSAPTVPVTSTPRLRSPRPTRSRS
jgi:membrane-bound lytic murein transglycosylase B